MRILGVDPGLRKMGIARLSTIPGSFKDNQYMSMGLALESTETVNVAKYKKHDDRIKYIFETMNSWLYYKKIDVVAVENIFMGPNRKTSLLSAEALGVIKLSARMLDAVICIYQPATIKRAVTGHGRSSKSEMSVAIRSIFKNVNDNASEHEIDAIAIAVTEHLHRTKRLT